MLAAQEGRSPEGSTCQANAANLVQEGCASAASRKSLREATVAVELAPGDAERCSKASSTARAMSGSATTRVAPASCSNARVGSSASCSVAASPASTAAQRCRTAGGAAAATASTMALHGRPCFRSCAHQSSHNVVAAALSTAAHLASAITPGRRSATALKISSVSSPKPFRVGSSGSTFCAHPTAVARKAVQARGLAASLASARRSSSCAGAHGDALEAEPWASAPASVGPLAAAAEASAAVSSGAAASPATPSVSFAESVRARRSRRWHATCISKCRNCPQSFAERGIQRMPRRSVVRAAWICPHLKARSAANNQKWTSRGCNFTARNKTFESCLTLPDRKQKSTYWYHSRTLPLNLDTLRLKIK
mmetsp:Transcript_29912/g.95401  ORF Transcript_29912/g.95401 Transcript_29912/m.95401 type:complete len:367 (+) Transcript_29912:679-1779(+)